MPAKFMAVKYMGVVDGQIGVLSSKVPIADDQYKAPIISSLSGR